MRVALALILTVVIPLLTGASVRAAETIDLLGVRVGLHGERTRFVFDLSGPAEYKANVLRSPPGIVLDFFDTRIQAALDDLSLQGTPVKRLTPAVSQGKDSRIVLDLTTDVKVKTFILSPSSDRGYRLVLDLYPTPGIATALASSGNTTAKESSTKSPVHFSGTWEQELAIETHGFDAQKFEAVVEPRWDMDLPNDWRFTAIARLRLDTVGDLGPDADRPENYSSLNGPWYNDKNVAFSLRELYLETEWGDSFWRIGKQQVVWGQADGIKVLDVVNPQSFREFILDDFDDSRIPLWMLNAEVPVGDDSSLQFLWIPDTTYHEMAEQGTPYAFTSSRLVPRAPTGIPSEVIRPDKPNNAFDDSDAGLRYSSFAMGWDVTLNYLYHYQDFQVPYQQLRFDESGVTALLTPEYERNHMLGGTLSNVYGRFTLRAELAYNTDTFHLSSDLNKRGIANSDEFTSVLGLDWRLGLNNTFVSAQWFQSHLLDYDGDIARDHTEHNLSLLYRRSFDNEAWNLSALTLYSLNHHDSWIQLKLAYFLRSNLEIWLGGDVFSGDKNGTFGQYSQRDRITLGFELGF